MRTPAIAAALVAAALIVPATAPAKEAKEGSVCGASRCVTVTDREALMTLVDSGSILSEPPQAAEFYNVTIVLGHEGEEHSFDLQMVPSRHAMRADDGTWTSLPAASERYLNRLVREEDLAPFPAAGLIGAAPAPDPAPAAAAEPGGLSWLERGLVVGALVLLAAGLIAVGHRRRPALRQRRGAAPSN